LKSLRAEFDRYPSATLPLAVAIGVRGQDVAAAARRGIGEDLTAAPGHEAGQLPGLSGHLGYRLSTTLTIVLSMTIVNVAAGAGHVQVERQHPPGTPAGVVHRHGARLARRVGRQGPGIPRGISTATVFRDPDVGRARDQGRDRTPRGLCVGTREAVRCRVETTRRVGRGQY
jgi:hypothetical protein